MKNNAAVLVVAWVVLSVLSMFLIFNLNLSTDLKINQFVCLNVSVLIGLCAFFIFNKNKISVLLGNYKRKKEF